MEQHFPLGLLPNVPNPLVLDLGGREVCPTQWRPDACRRIGVDIKPGPGVDLVADLHELSRHLEPASVDAAYSVAVWEHLLMPWKVGLELNRVLKPGGVAWVVTHRNFPIHEAPWDFYRFGAGAWRSLFNAGTGFEILDTVSYQQLQISPLARDISGFSSYGATQVQVRKVSEVGPELCRWETSLAEALPAHHAYPELPGRPTFWGKVQFKLDAWYRALTRSANFGAGSADDPWRLLDEQADWLVVRGPGARGHVPAARAEITLAGSGDAAYRTRLASLAPASFDRIALLDVLNHDAQPWTLPLLINPLLRDGGLVYVDAAQTTRAEGADLWGLSADAMFGLFHPGVGFEVVRSQMLDPARMAGQDLEESEHNWGWLRVLALARKRGPGERDRFAWPEPGSSV